MARQQSRQRRDPVLEVRVGKAREVSPAELRRAGGLEEQGAVVAGTRAQLEGGEQPEPLQDDETMGEARRRRELEDRGVSGLPAAQEAVGLLVAQLQAAAEAGGDVGAVARAQLVRQSMAQGMALAKGEDPPMMPMPIIGERFQPRENIELMNQLRMVQQQLADMVNSIQEGIRQVPDDAEQSAGMRWLAIGRTDLERGFMFLERATIRPVGGLAGPPEMRRAPQATQKAAGAPATETRQ